MRDYALLAGKRDLEPMGVVDIGSNSVRLVVYEGAVRSPTPIFNEKVLCGRGREIASTGRLDEESVKRALEALTRFRAILRLLDVKHVRAIATAACRDAANGPDFIVRGEKALGTRVQVLSGQQEAELAASGIDVQTGVEIGQTIPQAPQLSLSLVRSLQAPSQQTDFPSCSRQL